MTISDTATKFRYQGNAVTDTFAFGGKAFTTGDLVVQIITRATDVLEETLTITTDYAVTILTDGTASVVTVAGKIPSALQDIQILRELEQTQTTSLPVGTKFPAKLVENSMDRNTGLIQELDEKISRAVTFPITTSVTNPTFPTPVDDAVIVFDGTDGSMKTGATNTSLIAGAAAAAASAVAAATSESNASTSETNSSTSATLSENWATKTTGVVASSEYASKAYAIGGTGITNTSGKGAAKEWATKAEDSTVDTSGFSALHHAAKAAASAAGVNLPSITATDTGKILLVNAAGTAHELIATNGTSGQVLTSTGVDSLPTYQDAGGGQWSLVSTTAVSGSPSQVDITIGTAVAYKIYYTELRNSTHDKGLFLRLGVGTTFTSENYSYGFVFARANNTMVREVGSNTSTTDGIKVIHRVPDNASTQTLHGEIIIQNPSLTTTFTNVSFNWDGMNEDGNTVVGFGGGRRTDTSSTAFTTARFTTEATSTLEGGTFYLYELIV